MIVYLSIRSSLTAG